MSSEGERTPDTGKAKIMKTYTSIEISVSTKHDTYTDADSDRRDAKIFNAIDAAGIYAQEIVIARGTSNGQTFEVTRNTSTFTTEAIEAALAGVTL